MVAATKMKRAVEAVFRTRRYANLSWGTILNICNSFERSSEKHPFLKKPESVKKVAVILITSNRGLCGGFNTNLLSKMHRRIERLKKKENVNLNVDILAMGKKAYGAQKYYGYNIVADFEKPELMTSLNFNQVRVVGKAAKNGYLYEDYDQVFLAYTDYISASNQFPRIKQLLPIELDKKDEFLGKTRSVFGEKEELNSDILNTNCW